MSAKFTTDGVHSTQNRNMTILSFLSKIGKNSAEKSRELTTWPKVKVSLVSGAPIMIDS